MPQQLTPTPEMNISYNSDAFMPNEPIEHYHPAYELVFFQTAHINIFVKNKTLPIRDGDCLFINEFELHKVLYTPNTQYTRYVINFKKEYLQELLHLLQADDLLSLVESSGYAHLHCKLKQRADMEQYFRQLYDKHQHLQTAMDAASVKNTLIALLIHFYELYRQAAPTLPLNKTDRQVQAIIEYIDTNYNEAITLDLLQEKTFISKYHIAHLFRHLTGFSVIEYTQYRRIIEAQKLLRDTSQTVTEICYACGFNSIQHFCRVFKKFSHTTPAKYRRLT
ncbi:MAG: helix-turn-helix domain-containing protein [Firmicutes bacterium]|nr:helix-turn-helix domain-containing protein [Bacillota bacterium]